MNKTLDCLGALGMGCVALACGLAGGTLHAAIACSFNSVALRFPAYETFETSPTDGTGSVHISCTNLGTASASGSTVVLGIGASLNGTASDRKMASMRGGADLLRYGIYRDAARSLNWDQGPDAVVQGTGPLQARETRSMHFTLFGRIAPQQDVRAGTYRDLLVLTLTP